MPIRISGLVSGLDTESLVSELVSAYSVKKDNYVKSQTKLSWKQDAWKNLNKKVYSLYSSISSLRFSSAYSLKKTTVSDTTKASVTASSTAVNGTQKLVVSKLAATGYLTGGTIKKGDASDTSAATGSTKLSELKGNGFGLAAGESGSINVNGQEVKISGDDTINQVVTRLKDAGVNASFDEKNQRIFVSSKDSGTANEFTLTASNENGAKALQSLGLMTAAKTGTAANAAYQSLIDKYANKNADGSYASVSQTKIANAIISGELDVNSYNNADYQSAVRTYQYAKTLQDGGEAATALRDGYNAYTTAKANVDSLTESDFNKAVYDGLKSAGDSQLDFVFMTKDGAQVSLGDDGKIYKDGAEVTAEDGYKLSEDGKSILYEDAEDSSKNVSYTRSRELKASMESALTSRYPGAADVDEAYEKYVADTKTVSEYEATHSEADRADLEKVLQMDDATLAKTTTFKFGEADNVLYQAALAFTDKVKTANTALSGSGVYAASEGAVRVDATDAEITLNGAKFTGSTNNFQINGLTIDVTGTTDENGITITTSTDTQGIYDKVKDFLSQYNDLMNEMCSLYNASSAKGYEPLTSDEKSAMSDTQVEEWEAKIKSALLRRDSTLDGLISTMTGAMQKSYIMGKDGNGNNITFSLNKDGTYAGSNGKTYSLQNRSNGKYSFAADDGSTLSASSYSWSSFGVATLGLLNSASNEYNAYHIDGDSDDDSTSGKTDKLLAAIAGDPDTVIDFLKNATSSLYDSINKKMSSTTLRSAYTVYNDKEMNKEYSDYTDIIKKWENKVTSIEDSYYKKFAAMESALASIQGQSSALGGLF